METTFVHFVLKFRDWLDDFVHFSSLDRINFGKVPKRFLTK